MSLNTPLENHFKPEIRSAGREAYKKELAYIQNASDTQIQGVVKSMPPLRISLTSESIASTEFTATCTCTSATKGSLCKHIYAMLLQTQEKHPDFLDSKTSIEISTQEKKPNPQKEKQNEYKKEQYQKQKAYQKARKQKLEAEPREPFAPEIEAALQFFQINGFTLEDQKDAEQLKLAKKHLARVFHPDKGGTHDEAVILNKHYEILEKFFSK